MFDIEARPRFSCPDWWEKIQAGETPMADVPLNEERAAKALAFFNRLRLPDVAGTPTLREACGDWFRDMLCAFLASEDPDTHQRIVWECLCMVPKKNSKTTYVAALALTALYLDETPNSQMLLIGPSQNISARGFNQAQGMIRLDEKLKKIFKVQDHLKTITRRRTGTKLEVKTFDTSIVTGEIPIMTFIDELHELGGKAKAPSVMQQIRGGGITKKGGQVFFLTTQSDEIPTGIWKSELKKARAIRDGEAGDAPIMLPVIYEFPLDLQKNETFWREKKNWHLVLPNLGRSIDQKRLEDDYINNGSVSTEAEQIWVSQHLNIEIGVGLHTDRWIGADYWEKSAREDLTLEKILETSEVCVVGVDGGGLDDLFGLAVIGRHAETKVWQHWGKAWADKQALLARRNSIVSKLEELEQAEDFVFVDNMYEAYSEVTEICARIRDAGLLPEKNGIGMDPEAVGDIIDELTENEFTIDDIQSISQGYKLNSAIKSTPVKLKNKKMVHCGQALMAWCVSNAKTEEKGNAQLVTKAVSGTAKIDPLMALFDAVMLMSLYPVAGVSSITIPDNYKVA